MQEMQRAFCIDGCVDSGACCKSSTLVCDILTPQLHLTPLILTSVDISHIRCAPAAKIARIDDNSLSIAPDSRRDCLRVLACIRMCVACVTSVCVHKTRACAGKKGGGACACVCPGSRLANGWPMGGGTGCPSDAARCQLTEGYNSLVQTCHGRRCSVYHGRLQLH